MIDSRTLIPIGCLLVTGALALAQTPPPAPPPAQAPVAAPAYPAPPAPPAAAPTPQPAAAPRAPAALLDPDDLDRIRELAQDARDQAQATRDYLEAQKPLYQLTHPPTPPAIAPGPLYQLTHPTPAPGDWVRDGIIGGIPGGIGGGIGCGIGVGIGNGYALNVPMAFAQSSSIGMAGRPRMSDDRLYDAGLRALDNHRWDEALEDFNQVASRGGARADGGWYWKAYTLSKLGRRDEALAAVAELRKSYANSRWLDEAKALEIEVRQHSNQPVSPEGETDEDLKLMALNGIMQSDPDRAIPLVENILKGSASPRLKARALFVLAQSGTPRGLQIIEQIARGGGNPDLQVKAIEYLGQRRRQPNNNQNQLLLEIYNSTNDLNVKRAVLNTFRSARDYERLAQIAKTEKASDLRMEAFNPLGDVAGQPELWQIYQSETSPDMRIAILRVMLRNGNADKLVEVIRNEKDPKVRRTAIDVLATQQTGAADRLVSVYSAEQDTQLRQAIVDALSNQRNAKYLVDLAKAEKDPKLKLRIVDRLSSMHSKEATDYLLELLSK